RRVCGPPPEESGLPVNLDSHVSEAMRAGRSNGLIQNVQQFYAIWKQGLDLPLRITVDERALQSYLKQNGAALEVAPTEASLNVDPETGHVVAGDSAKG